MEAHATSIGDWLGQISRCLACGKENTLALAQLLCSAKRHLHHEQWSQLWNTGQLPFSRRKGQMLVAIGQRLAGLNAQTFARLPGGWSILYQLSKLSRPILVDQVRLGKVHPGLTLQAARALVAALRGEVGPEGSILPRVLERLRSFREFVESSMDQWSRAQRDRAHAELSRLLEKIAGTTNRFDRDAPVLGAGQHLCGQTMIGF